MAVFIKEIKVSISVSNEKNAVQDIFEIEKLISNEVKRSNNELKKEVLEECIEEIEYRLLRKI